MKENRNPWFEKVGKNMFNNSDIGYMDEEWQDYNSNLSESNLSEKDIDLNEQKSEKVD